ncbi:MAG: hypothetical protein K2P50_01255 [Lachnospiraceae bacterium]|nr:hypothetical protein [Lachnospiraceae bacterium]
MNKEQFRAEKLYRMSLSVAKSMLDEGIISEDELGNIDEMLLQKYRPVLGMLLSGRRVNKEDVF